MQLPEFVRCSVGRNEANRGLRQPHAIEDAEETHQGHAQGINAQVVSAQHARQVYLENVASPYRENRSRKKDSGLARDVSDLRTKLLRLRRGIRRSS